MVDAFFNCFNFRSTSAGEFVRKPNLLPYTSTNDERFDWLRSEFLKYFETWKSTTQNRNGNFSKSDRGRMFISWQTYQGLHISTNSIIEATKFLLNQGMEFVLTKRFCQDPVEQYFGNQRKFGRRNDNPDLFAVGYYDNTIRIQKSISLSSGNNRWLYDNKKNWVNVTDEKLLKRNPSKNERIDF